MKIAIVKLSAMGDIIHAMVALEFIKKNIPDARIDWIVEESFMGILNNNPSINTIIPINLKSIKQDKSAIITEYKRLGKIAKNNYDVVIDAQGLIKSALTSWLIGNRVVGSFVAGFDRDSIREGIASWFYGKKVFIPYEKNVIERSCKVMSEPLGFSISKEDILNKSPFLFTNETFEEKDYIVFIVGASRPNKIYPKEKFLEIAQRLEKKIIVVWGNKEEEQVASWLEENSTFIEKAPKGNLEKLKAIIKNADLVIGGDTGPTHIAWGMNVPSITIFGNTPEYRNTYTTPINLTIKSSSFVNPLKLDKSDFSINEIKASEIVQMAKGLLR